MRQMRQRRSNPEIAKAGGIKRQEEQLNRLKMEEKLLLSFAYWIRNNSLYF
jgi:hypothetical protein